VTSRQAIDFYNSEDLARCGREELREDIGTVVHWYERCPLHLRQQAVLELGCGRGPLSGISPHYVGLDLSLRAIGGTSPRHRGVNGDMEELPFRTDSVAFILSWAAIEHVPNPERVLAEVARVLAPEGIAVLNPAWHCRSWAAEGLEFRAYSDLSLFQKVRKAMIPLRNSLLLRAPGEVFSRVRREIMLRGGKAIGFDYARLTPNLERYLGTDSDAFTSLDPHAMIVWFHSRGWRVLSHPTSKNRFLARHEPVVIQKKARTVG